MCFKLCVNVFQTIMLLIYSSTCLWISVFGSTTIKPNAEWMTDQNPSVTPVSDIFFTYYATFNFVPSIMLTRPMPKALIWDKAKINAKQYQLSMCPYACNGTEKVNLRYLDNFNLRYLHSNLDGCYDFTCFGCDCDKPRCEIYGTCCPDISESFKYEYSDFQSKETSTSPLLQTESSHEDAKNEAVKLICEKYDERKKYGRLVVKSCPQQFTDENMRRQCEEDTPASMQTPQLFTHVYDNVTGVTFFNRFCAFCNGVEEKTLIQWELSVTCQHYGKVYKASDYDEFFRLVLDPQSTCKISQKPNVLGNDHSCSQYWFEATVDRCNVTGQWQDYDEDVEKACTSDLSRIAYRVQVHDMIGVTNLKNIFCAVCNMRNYPMFPNPCVSYRTRSIDRSGYIDLGSGSIFSFLINFDTQDSRRPPEPGPFQKCSQGVEWASPDDMCMPLQCTPGKILVNDTCTTAVDQIKQLAYKVELLLLPVNASSSGQEIYDVVSFLDVCLRGFSRKFDSMFAKIGYQWDITYSLVVNQSVFDTTPSVETNKLDLENTTDSYDRNLTPVKWFAVHGTIVASASLSRDEFELRVMEELFGHDMTIQISEDMSMVVEPVLAMSEREDMLRCDGINSTKLLCLSLADFGLASENMLDRWNERDMLVLGRTLICPHISFNKSEYIIETDRTTLPPTINITLTCFNSTSFMFTEPKELKMISTSDDGNLNVCHELLQTKMEEHLKHIRQLDSDSVSTLERWQYILSLFCVAVSIACLVLTLLTYSVFSQLRSVAGRNNMCLSGSLLIAQIFLIITFHTRKRGFPCTFLGIMAHFSWLSMFCWCCACCFHMFRIFTAKTRSANGTTKSEIKLLMKRAATCFGVPALIIIAVIVISHVASGGQRIGYGAVRCYLDSTLLLITTMVVPLVLILLCNFVFFTVTVVKIHNIRKLQMHADFKKSDRDNFYVYIKLSSITGTFWIVHLIAEAVNNDVLKFIALFLNGLQGLFIFLSFICNKRVLKLYTRALGLETHIPVTSTSGRGTITRLASEVNRLDKSDRAPKHQAVKSSVSDEDGIEVELNPGIRDSDGEKGVSDVEKCHMSDSEENISNGVETCSSDGPKVETVTDGIIKLSGPNVDSVA